MSDRIKQQIQNLAIPYPQRHLLLLEVQQDLESTGQCGTEQVFSEQDLMDLGEIHSTWLHRFLRGLGEQRRKRSEMAMAFIPLVATFTYITKEATVISFIREGGAGMYLILIVGAILLGREMLNLFRLIVVRDHCKENLRVDTPSVIIGCLALMFIGVGWTTLGVYKSADAVIQSHLSYQWLITGAKESMAALILSSLISAVVILFHYGTRRALCVWRAPIVE